MVDDSTDETSTDERDLSRRGYLAATGGIGAGLTAGYAGYRYLEDGAADDAAPSDGPVENREDFLWLGGGLWRDEAIRENLFAFARRHDLAVVLVKSHSTEEALDENVRSPLAAAGEYDLDVWLNVGLLNDVSAETFVADADAREAHLERLREVARVHDDLFDGGRVVLWQEAPVMGEWAPGGEWTEAAVENLLEHGPAIFDAQKRAVESAADGLEVGLFVHFPYIVDSKRPGVFRSLAERLRRRNAVPDFAFGDFYRGWYEKDVGPEPADAAVRSLVSNARAALEDRPMFYLGQCHTINPNHTPSKQAMRMNLRASIEAGASGVGWYVGSGYEPTESGFDPFVPNVAGAEIRSEPVNTLTIARDRFLYPWLATLESDGFAAGEAFDLWLLGNGFGFHDHRLSVRTVGGDWEYVGDFGGYADGDYPDGSAATDRATVFRALDRDRLLDGGELECRVETSASSSGADLRGAFAMPCDPAAYVSEREAAEMARGDAPLEEFALGRTTESTALPPGETRRLSIPVGDEGASSLRRLRRPEYAERVETLAAFEERADVDPDAYFDLWLTGTGLAEPSALPSIVDREGTERAPAEVGLVASIDAAAVCHGLERDRFLGDGLKLADDGEGSVEAAYAMPYAGSAVFRTPARVAELLDGQPDEARTFSLEHETPE